MSKLRKRGAGTIQWRNDHQWVRVSLPDGTRPWYRLCGDTCICHTMSDERAQEKAAALSESERERVAAEIMAANVARGPIETVQSFGEKWTEGKLHDKWPDHIKAKRSARDDRERLAKHVYPVVGGIAIADFTLDDADRLMSTLPRTLSGGTRRQIAQAVHRLLTMAVYPARLRESSPLPKGWLPKVKSRKAAQWLYPAEEAQLLACIDIPAGDRLLFGFLAREGMRASEALGLTWGEVDLSVGSVRLDANKTDDPRAWALGDDVAAALGRYRVACGSPAAGLIFCHADGRAVSGDHLAERFRAALRKAGINRAELFEKSKARQPIRLHDLRGTFVTLALANGRTETWVADRTGHQSSAMIGRYRRAARHAAELGLGWLRPLHKAMPEIAELRNVRLLSGSGR